MCGCLFITGLRRLGVVEIEKKNQFWSVLQMLIYLTEIYMKMLPKGKMQGHIRH